MPMPSFVTFWPVLPSVTVGTGDSAGGSAARSRSADARAAPAAAVAWRNRRRLPPPDPLHPSIATPRRGDRPGLATPADRAATARLSHRATFSPSRPRLVNKDLIDPRSAGRRRTARRPGRFPIGGRSRVARSVPAASRLIFGQRRQGLDVDPLAEILDPRRPGGRGGRGGRGDLAVGRQGRQASLLSVIGGSPRWPGRRAGWGSARADRCRTGPGIGAFGCSSPALGGGWAGTGSGIAGPGGPDWDGGRRRAGCGTGGARPAGRGPGCTPSAGSGPR